MVKGWGSLRQKREKVNSDSVEYIDRYITGE